MRKNRHTPEEIVSKLRQVDVLVAQGTLVADAVRSIGVTEVTSYRWRQEDGGLKVDQVRRMKELETENQRLRKAVADLTLDKLILQEAARGNLLPPCTPARLCRTRDAGPERLRAPRLQGARSASLNSAQSAAGPRGRRAAHRRSHRAGTSIRPLRLSQDQRAPQRRGLAGERQAGRAHLAPRGAQSAGPATQARAAVVGGRVLPPAAARVP